VWDVYRPRQNALFSTIEGRDRRVANVGLVFYWVLVPIAIAGVVVLRRRRTMVWPLVAPVVVVCATAAYAYGVTRFRVPAEVALVVLAAPGLDAAFSSLRRSP
jgi:hypothetical protein